MLSRRDRAARAPEAPASSPLQRQVHQPHAVAAPRYPSYQPKGKAKGDKGGKGPPKGKGKGKGKDHKGKRGWRLARAMLRSAYGARARLRQSRRARRS